MRDQYVKVYSCRLYNFLRIFFCIFNFAIPKEYLMGSFFRFVVSKVKAPSNLLSFSSNTEQRNKNDKVGYIMLILSLL